MDFLISKEDLHSCRVADTPAPEPAPGEALLRVERFGLSANNITYATFGERMSYWSFFPAAPGWGRMPVWGFAQVSASAHDELAVGARVYGYLPPSSELIVTPARVSEQGFIDAAEHRAQLPPVYNAYARVEHDPIYDPATEDLQMLLRPLFLTSYLIDDFLDEGGFFGAGTVVLSSASSKTASALAFMLSQREGVDVVGLTSARSLQFTRSLGVYGEVLAYEQIDSLPASATVYVDMAGDAGVRRALHEHLTDELVHSAVVGATHHEQMGDVPAGLPGAPPTFFFAPEWVRRRNSDWGRAVLEERMAEAWRPYVEWASGWLQVIHGDGPEALEDAYLAQLDGRVDPATAHVLSLPR